MIPTECYANNPIKFIASISSTLSLFFNRIKILIIWTTATLSKFISQSFIQFKVFYFCNGN